MKNKFAFGQQPVLRRRRSMFDLSYSNKTSMSVGKLYPIYLQEIYPGDTFKCESKFVSRVTSSFLKPVMDNLFMDVFYFFVPNRLVFDRWNEVMGENTQSPWAQTASVDVPTIGGFIGNSFIYSKSVGDYLGFPLGGYQQDLYSVLPFRGFALIWDQWFRDQNIDYPMNINKGVRNPTPPLNKEKPNNDLWSPSNYFGQLPPVSKTHDYFTSCLPAPQKGDAVDLFGFPDVKIPVTARSEEVPNNSETVGLYFRNLGSTPFPEGYSYLGGYRPASGLGESIEAAVLHNNSQANPTSTFNVVPSNLWADTSSIAGSLNVNDLRNAIALQRMLEKDAEGGTRYTEYLLSHFGVSSPDMRLDRTELLGGTRIPISIQQVAQTSNATDTSPLGNLAAYSLSNGRCRYTKGFTEHGFVIGVACIKYFHTYQQGMERFWRRTKRTDFYDPVFANLGNQPVYQNEIYANESNGDVIFGYNEAWADLRYRPNRVTGEMRTDPQAVAKEFQSQDIYHFADMYSSAPTLNSQFIHETPAYVDRALSVPSTSEDQFIVDIYHQQKAYRVLPVYSTPSHLGVR